MPVRPVAQKIVIAAATTSTGNSTGVALFGMARQPFTLYHKAVGSTKNIAFKVQGTVGESGVWVDLIAATTGSTSGTAINTTSAFGADKVRVNVTANATTGNCALTVWVAPQDV